MSDLLYHCQNCNFEWYYPYPDGRYCPECDSENIYRYPEPKFSPQQWVRYKPYGPVYPSKNEQIAQVRPDGKGGWLYLLPKELYPPDSPLLAEFPEDALEAGEYESRPRHL